MGNRKTRERNIWHEQFPKFHFRIITQLVKRENKC